MEEHMSSSRLRSYEYNHVDEPECETYIAGRMKKIRPYLRKVRTVLELGCGNGAFGARIKEETDADVYGIDISSSGVALSKKRGIKALVKDLNADLPYRDRMFDLVISDQVLEHVTMTDHLMDEIHRILKPGGYVITCTPNLSFWFNRVFFLFGLYPIFLEAGEKSKTYGMRFLTKYITDKEAMGHIRVFNTGALEDMCKAHHFTILDVYGMPLSWNLPMPLKMIYDTIDQFFSLFPSLARDSIVIAKK